MCIALFILMYHIRRNGQLRALECAGVQHERSLRSTWLLEMDGRLLPSGADIVVKVNRGDLPAEAGRYLDMASASLEKERP